MAQVLTLATDTETNDIYLDGNYNLVVSEDKYAQANIVLNVIRTDKGELQFSKSSGIPYFSTIFSTGRPNLEMWRYFVTLSVLDVDGIKSVDSFEYSVSDGVLSYTIKATSNLGDLTING